MALIELFHFNSLVSHPHTEDLATALISNELSSGASLTLAHSSSPPLIGLIQSSLSARQEALLLLHFFKVYFPTIPTPPPCGGVYGQK